MKIIRQLLWFFILKIVSPCLVSIIEKAADIADDIFLKHFVTSVVWSDDNPDDIEVFVKRYQGAVVLTSLPNANTETIRNIHSIKGYQQTVFLTSRPEELVSFMEVLKEYLVVPIRIVLVLTKVIPEKKLTELVKSAWELDFANILIVSPNDNCTFKLRTYFPYREGTCNNFTLVTLADNTTNLFPKKFRNFYGCDVRSTLLEMAPYNKIKFEYYDNNTVASITGIDANIFTLLFQVVNANIRFVSAMKHGSIGVVVNGTVTGCLGALVNETADIFCPAVIITASRYSIFQISHVFETANIYWFGPRRQEISEWLRVLQTFMTQVTPALLTSFLIFIVTVMVVRRFGLHKSNSKDSVLFQSFVILMGQIVKLEKKSWLINGLFLLWIWFCLVVRIAYQGDLINGMQKTKLEFPLGSFTDALKQVDGYGGVQNFREYVKGTPHYDDYEVLDFFDVPQYLKDMAAGKRFLILTDRLIAYDASRHVQMIGQNPVTQVPVTFYMRPGWPPAEEVDVILQRLIESGFVHKILYTYFHRAILLRRARRNENRDAIPLTMDTLIGCFYALGALYFICFFVFIMEIIYFKKYGEKKRLKLAKRKRGNNRI